MMNSLFYLGWLIDDREDENVNKKGKATTQHTFLFSLQGTQLLLQGQN